MIFRELNLGKCKTYLIACENTHRAVLVDPVRDKIDRYLSLLGYYQLKLDDIIDTHTHADHRTATFELKDLTGANVIMHRRAPAPYVDIHMDDGETVTVGDLAIKILHTPGHTPDSMSLYVKGKVLTGDTLLIRGTGRCDFAGGDAGAQFEAITQKLFQLPEETQVFPAHDYRGNTMSTIGDEKRLNPRVAGQTKEAYVNIMANLGLPLPDNIQEVLQPNQTALDDDRIAFPSLAELNQVRQLSPQDVQVLLAASPPPLLLDVREPSEYTGELGHIAGSLLIPLKELPSKANEIEDHKNRHVVAICRSGVRSTTAAAILTGLGFEQVSNLRGGMVDWNDQNLPITR